MKHNRIRLTESQLQSLVTEAARSVLSEVSFPKMYGAYNGYKQKGAEFRRKYREALKSGDQQSADKYERLSNRYFDKADGLKGTFNSLYGGVGRDGIRQTFGVGNDQRYSVSTEDNSNDSITGSRSTYRSITGNSSGDRTEYNYEDDYRTSADKYQPKTGDTLARSRRRTDYSDGSRTQSSTRYQMQPNHDYRLRHEQGFNPWVQDEYQGEFESPEFDRLRDKNDRMRQWFRGERDSSEFRTDGKKN